MSEQKEQGLAVQKLRERSVSMLDAGHVDDAALDIEAADALQVASEREAKLREERDRAQSACTAWQQVFESIEAYLQDRIAMDDPGQPETYLSIIRGDVAGVLRASEQIVAARWAHYRIHEARATAAETALATAREALRANFCPRPCNHRPADFEVGPCIDAGECGCMNVQALKTKEPSHG